MFALVDDESGPGGLEGAPPPVVDVGGLVATFREYRRLVELVLGAVAAGAVPAGPSLDELEASVGRVMTQLDAAGIDPRSLVAEDRPTCGCLCPMHRLDGMGCESWAAVKVTLAGGALPGERPVGMCRWCAGWWQRVKAHRVVRVEELV